jgi:hypothetical protein
MLAIGYWCETGCRGRIELRAHKGHLYLSLHEEPFGLPDFVTSPSTTRTRRPPPRADADRSEPAF